jgi:hypothetical protein
LWNISYNYEKCLHQLSKCGRRDAFANQGKINKKHAGNEKYCSRQCPVHTENGDNKSETVQSFTYMGSEVNCKK